MSRKLKKEKSIEYGKSQLLLSIIKGITDIYLFLLICIYPLVIQPGYGNTSYVKYNFLIGISYAIRIGVLPIPTYIPVVLILALIGIILYIRESGKTVIIFIREIRLSATDIAALVYTAVLLLSSIISSYKDEIIWGYPTWNMGLASQFLFVALYFIISRSFDIHDLEFLTYGALFTSTIVFLIQLCQLFGFNVFHLYSGEIVRSYISTMGNINWFASYIIIFFTIGFFIVWFFDRSTRIYKVGLVYLIITSISLVTQGSDSVYAGLFAAFSFFLLCSFGSNKRLARLLENFLIVLLSWRLIGFILILMKDRIPELQFMSAFMSQGSKMWIIIAVIALLYLLIRRKSLQDEGYSDKRARLYSWIFLGLLILICVSFIIYIYLNTKSLLPDRFTSTNNLLYFDAVWGSKRGCLWHDTVVSFIQQFKAEPLKCIFGVGADQYYHFLSNYYSVQVEQIHGSATPTNAHNEWLTSFANFGILGGLSYIAFFLSFIFRGYRSRESLPYAMGAAACAAAYMGNNFFSFQQYVCTPYIFVIIAIGEQIIRTVYTGSESR